MLDGMQSKTLKATALDAFRFCCRNLEGVGSVARQTVVRIWDTGFSGFLLEYVEGRSSAMTGSASDIWLVNPRKVCRNLHTLLLAYMSVTLTVHSGGRRVSCVSVDAVRLVAVIMWRLGLPNATFDKLARCFRGLRKGIADRLGCHLLYKSAMWKEHRATTGCTKS